MLSELVFLVGSIESGLVEVGFEFDASVGVGLDQRCRVEVVGGRVSDQVRPRVITAVDWDHQLLVDVEDALAVLLGVFGVGVFHGVGVDRSAGERSVVSHFDLDAFAEFDVSLANFERHARQLFDAGHRDRVARFAHG